MNNDSNIEGLAKSSLLYTSHKSDAHQQVSFWAETLASMCNLSGMLASLLITEHEPW